MIHKRAFRNVCTGRVIACVTEGLKKPNGMREAFIEGITLKIRTNPLDIPGRGNKIKRARDLKT